MIWQRLKYGTVVAAGIAVTGSLVWFSDSPYIAAVDVLEVIQGTQERCWNTQTTLGSNTVFVSTNYVPVYGDDPRDYFWVTNAWSGTNWVAHSNRYKIVVSTNQTPFSVTNQIGYAWDVDPMSWSNYFVSVSPNDRYILSLTTNEATSNVTVRSAMPQGTQLVFNAIDNYSPRDLHQLYTDKIRELVPYYVNHHLADAYGSFGGMTNLTFPRHSLDDSPTSIWTYADCGTIIPVWVDSFSIVTNLHIFSDETNTATWVTLGSDSAWDAFNPQLVSWYTSKTNLGERADLLYQLQWTERDAVTQWSSLTNSDDWSSAYVTAYIDREGGTNAEAYLRRGDLYNLDLATAKAGASTDWNAASWVFSSSSASDDAIYSWTRIYGYSPSGYKCFIHSRPNQLKFTNSAPFDVTLKFWGINEIRDLENGEHSAQGTSYTIDAPEQNEIGSVTVPSEGEASTAEFGTRNEPSVWPTTPPASNVNAYAGFNMQVDDFTTHMWQPDPAANIYEFRGESRASWAEAKARAQENLILGNWETNMAHHSTWCWGTAGEYTSYTNEGYNSTGVWVSHIYQEQFEARLDNLNTNNAKTVDWYLRAQPLSKGTYTNSYLTVNGEDVHYPTSVWHLVGSDTFDAGTHSVTSSPIGSASTSTFPPWCGDPENAPDGKCARGWQGNTVKAVIKWGNSYCTNDIP